MPTRPEHRECTVDVEQNLARGRGVVAEIAPTDGVEVLQ